MQIRPRGIDALLDTAEGQHRQFGGLDAQRLDQAVTTKANGINQPDEDDVLCRTVSWSASARIVSF
jgi:hypothetical protein